jgi:hypothetical protein
MRKIVYSIATAAACLALSTSSAFAMPPLPGGGSNPNMPNQPNNVAQPNVPAQPQQPPQPKIPPCVECDEVFGTKTPTPTPSQAPAQGGTSSNNGGGGSSSGGSSSGGGSSSSSSGGVGGQVLGLAATSSGSDIITGLGILCALAGISLYGLSVTSKKAGLTS